MIPMLAAIMAGYGLGSFIPGPRTAYLLCLPVSVLVYLLTKILASALGDAGITYPAIEMLLAVGLFQSPVLMLGVYLARRKAKRSPYKL